MLLRSHIAFSALFLALFVTISAASFHPLYSLSELWESLDIASHFQLGRTSKYLYSESKVHNQARISASINVYKACFIPGRNSTKMVQDQTVLSVGFFYGESTLALAESSTLNCLKSLVEYEKIWVTRRQWTLYFNMDGYASDFIDQMTWMKVIMPNLRALQAWIRVAQPETFVYVHNSASLLNSNGGGQLSFRELVLLRLEEFFNFNDTLRNLHVDMSVSELYPFDLLSRLLQRQKFRNLKMASLKFGQLADVNAARIRRVLPGLASVQTLGFTAREMCYVNQPKSAIIATDIISDISHLGSIESLSLSGFMKRCVSNTDSSALEAMLGQMFCKLEISDIELTLESVSTTFLRSVRICLLRRARALSMNPNNKFTANLLNVKIFFPFHVTADSSYSRKVGELLNTFSTNVSYNLGSFSLTTDHLSKNLAQRIFYDRAVQKVIQSTLRANCDAEYTIYNRNEPILFIEKSIYCDGRRQNTYI